MFVNAITFFFILPDSCVGGVQGINEIIEMKIFSYLLLAILFDRFEPFLAQGKKFNLIVYLINTYLTFRGPTNVGKQQHELIGPTLTFDVGKTARFSFGPMLSATLTI